MEIEVLKGIKEGDEKVYSTFYNEYSPRLHAVIYFLCNDRQQAEDIVQEAFLRLWQNRNNLNENQSLKGYLRTISKNLFLDNNRKNKTQSIYKQSLVEPVSNDVNDQSSHNELNSVILSAISKFSLEKQEMYIGSRLNGMSYNEIAIIKNTTPKAVERHISKVSFYLKWYLKRYYYTIFFAFLLNLFI